MAIAERSAAVTESGSTQGLTATMPAGVQDFDVLVAWVVGDDDATHFTGPGAGWTEVSSPNPYNFGNTQMTAAYICVVDDAGAIPAFSFSTTHAAGRWTIIVVAFSGVDNAFPIDAPRRQTEGLGLNSIQLNEVATTTDEAMLISGVGSGYSTDGWIGPSGMTVDATHTSGVGRGAAFAHELQPTAGASGTRTWTRDTATDTGFQGIMAALRPAGAPASVTWWACGAADQGGATVAAKIANGASARLKVATDSGLTAGVVFGSAVAPDSDGYAKLSITGLNAGTQYYYGIEVDGTVVSGADGKFRTAPSSAASFTVGFGSCANGESIGLDHLDARDPDLFIHLGDLGYWNIATNDEDSFRNKWDTTITRASYAGPFRDRASAYVWSDHDFGLNNADGTSASNPAANAVYRQVFAHYALESGGSTGIYQTFAWGRVRFILTDNRSFKDPITDVDDANKRLLGATQVQWLKDTITDATEELIVWCCENPWIEDAGPGNDAWGSYDTERQDLANFFASCGKPIVILAGDMHGLAYDDGTNAPGGNPDSSGDGVMMVCHGGPFYQNASIKGGPYSGGEYPASGSAIVQQYGFLTVTDTGADTITVEFSGYDDSDVAQITGSKTITLDASPALATLAVETPDTLTLALEPIDSLTLAREPTEHSVLFGPSTLFGTDAPFGTAPRLAPR